MRGWMLGVGWTLSASIALGSRLVPHYCQARAGAGEWNGREIFSLDRPLRDGAMRAGVGGQGEVG